MWANELINSSQSSLNSQTWSTKSVAILVLYILFLVDTYKFFTCENVNVLYM